MKYIFLISCLILSACQSRNNFLQSWIGKSEAELVETWGAPADMETLPDGNQVFTYIKEISQINDFGGKLIYYCQIKFETKNDIIFDYTLSEQDCPVQ